MSENKDIKILFFGDIVGRVGRTAIIQYLTDLTKKNEMPDFVIANVENASHGFGLTSKNYGELADAGVNCMTSGNHIWDKKDIFTIIDTSEKLVRPLNYEKSVQGEGLRYFDVNGRKIAVLNFLGRVFMQPLESPFEIIRDRIEEIKTVTPNIIIDFHAEATAEKICFGRFCSELGVSAVFGTHTHVQTADEQILGNMAYITDAGFCGSVDSVIGMDYETSIKRLITHLPYRYDVATGSVAQINAVEVSMDLDKGIATDIKRIYFNVDISNKKEIESEKSIE